MAISIDDDGTPCLSDECTVAELGEWVRQTARIGGDLWDKAVASEKVRRDIETIIEDAEAQQSLGMEWTPQRVAVLLMLADSARKKHGHTDEEMEAFIKISMTMLAGYPECLQQAIEIDMATPGFRLREDADIRIAPASN